MIKKYSLAFFIVMLGVGAVCADSSTLEVVGAKENVVRFVDYKEKYGGWHDIKFRSATEEFKIYSLPARADSAEDGVVASSDISMMSPQKKYLMVQRTDAGEVVDENGKEKISSQAYCDVISMETGCVKNIGSVQQCDGAWHGEVWKMATGKIFDTSTGGVSPSGLIANVAGVTESESRASLLRDYIFMGVPSYMACYPPEKSISSYNDLAFYLAQGGEHQLAMQIYNELLPLAPDRIPLKLNVADSLWALGRNNEAKVLYVDYRAAMLKRGMLEKVPVRVGERLGQ
ncbi:MULTISPECIES: tetratricopeptide repeat protein [unclassified Pseudomonas]|uniref:tetratricopeptide repeat protein n=1 Tax=unclassified Pseudomonas TaxID=196821 RepID=UPI00200C79DF|nr:MULTISPECIES: tetratricopeptide repeat protein [unclassified Pseudomonas]